MAWQQVTTNLAAIAMGQAKGSVRARVTRGGLTMRLGAKVIRELGWSNDEPLALMLGGGDSDGKLALKRDPSGDCRLAVYPSGRGKGAGSLRLGRFDALAIENHTGDGVLVPFEISGGMLIITPPDGWLKRRLAVVADGRTIGIARRA